MRNPLNTRAVLRLIPQRWCTKRANSLSFVLIDVFISLPQRRVTNGTLWYFFVLIVNPTLREDRETERTCFSPAPIAVCVTRFLSRSPYLAFALTFKRLRSAKIRDPVYLSLPLDKKENSAPRCCTAAAFDIVNLARARARVLHIVFRDKRSKKRRTQRREKGRGLKTSPNNIYQRQTNSLRSANNAEFHIIALHVCIHCIQFLSALNSLWNSESSEKRKIELFQIRRHIIHLRINVIVSLRETCFLQITQEIIGGEILCIFLIVRVFPCNLLS